MNNKMKKWTILLCTAIMVAGLMTACSKNGNDEVSPSASPTATTPVAETSTPSPSADPETEDAVETEQPSDNQSGEDVSEKPAIELPATKDFTFNLEGNEEVRTGKLAQGDGYALYFFDHFNFDAKTSRLAMNIDKDYYVDIEKLPADYKLEDIKADAEKELAELGEVRSTAGAEINPLLGGASLFLVGSNDQLTKEVIVKEVEGTAYLFKLNMPHREASEGFGQFAFTSISSITNQ